MLSALLSSIGFGFGVGMGFVLTIVILFHTIYRNE
jgi:hypothetical protein